MIKVSNLSKVFRTEEIETTALNGVSFEIKDGEFVAVMGPSGCGKSTLLNILGLLDNPTSGSYELLGTEVANLKEKERTKFRKGNIGFVFQSFNLIDELNVYENIELPLRYLNISASERKAKVTDIMKRMAISHRAGHFPQQLSGGQQQRVAIARTLAPEPSVLFMDEPLSNLDAKLRLEMRSELQRLHIETGSTFVYVTHDQMEAMTLATKICLIENGLLQQYEAPLTVYGRPANTFVADFVGNPAINFIEAKAEQNGNGSLSLELLDGRMGTFTPETPLQLRDWYFKADLADAERAEKLAEKAKQKGYVEKGNKDSVFHYHIAKVNEVEDLGDEPVLTDEDLVLGVRPEFIEISKYGSIEGEIYSAMPTGMETTVRIRVGEYLLTGVVFGGVLYQIGEKVRFSFRGEDIVLFSRRNGRLIAQGKLTVK